MSRGCGDGGVEVLEVRGDGKQVSGGEGVCMLCVCKHEMLQVALYILSCLFLPSLRCGD